MRSDNSAASDGQREHDTGRNNGSTHCCGYSMSDSPFGRFYLAGVNIEL
jgi:hypothetical protein